MRFSAPESVDLQAIQSCVAFCKQRQMSPICLALPLEIAAGQQQELLEIPDIVGLITNDATSLERVEAKALGRFDVESYNWVLPTTAARTIAYVGPRRNLSFRMITRARRRGVTWLVYASPGAWQRERTVRFIVFRVYEKLTALLMRAYQVVRHPLRRHSRRLLRLSTQKRQVPGRSVTDWRGKVLSPLAHFVEGRFTRRFRDVLAEPFVPLVAPTDFVRDRIVLANASLAWGGAERQIVNTMTGLKQRGYTDLHLICEHLHSRPEHDFYLWHLQREGIPAHELRRVFSETIIGGDALVIRLARALDALPPNLADDILAFALEFLELRPHVVHAWQDATNIKAGFAAAIVGVPVIVLNGRNMAPYNFSYFMPYMRGAYTVFGDRQDICLVNNSRAGARDYESWLGFASGAVNVVFNGLRSDSLVREPQRAQSEYRSEVGIPAHSKVVGSIFRLYEEKGPILWVETAALIAECVPDVVFLLIGKGPFRDRIRERAADLGILDRLFMPGTERNAQLPLSVMDVFLLTSRLEGTPNVSIEAQWLGVPVIAPDVGGTADTILQGVTGWITPRRTRKLLAQKVCEVLQDDEWRSAAGRKAHAFAGSRFGLDRMIDDTVALYGLPGIARETSPHGVSPEEDSSSEIKPNAQGQARRDA